MDREDMTGPVYISGAELGRKWGVSRQRIEQLRVSGRFSATDYVVVKSKTLKENYQVYYREDLEHPSPVRCHGVDREHIYGNYRKRSGSAPAMVRINYLIEKDSYSAMQDISKMLEVSISAIQRQAVADYIRFVAQNILSTDDGAT